MVDRFRFLKLGMRSRMVIAAMLFALATTVDIAAGIGIAGLPFVIAAWFVLALKTVTNKPNDKGLEEWRAVTDGEVARIADNLKRSRGLRATIAGPSILKSMLLVSLLILSLGMSSGAPRASMAFFNLGLFAVPGLMFGRLKAHIPLEFNLKLTGFLAAMNVPRPQDYILTPYLRFDKDADGRDVPEDLRLMLEPKRKPADLVGIQFQAAINNGANGKVPYMYAVVLTKGKDGQTHRKFATMGARGYEVEPGGDKEYGTVVVRQDTGGGGYHTTDDDCESLMVLMMKAMAKVEA
jgi:hypothetical protein